MKYLAIFVVLAMASCRSTPSREEVLAQAVTSYLHDMSNELKKAGLPTDARIEEAIPKVPKVIFPTDLASACKTINIPEIWMSGLFTYEEDGPFIWYIFQLTDNYSIQVKCKKDDDQILYGLKIVHKSKPEDK